MVSLVFYPLTAEIRMERRLTDPRSVPTIEVVSCNSYYSIQRTIPFLQNVRPPEMCLDVEKRGHIGLGVHGTHHII